MQRGVSVCTAGIDGSVALQQGANIVAVRVIPGSNVERRSSRVRRVDSSGIGFDVSPGFEQQADDVAVVVIGPGTVSGTMQVCVAVNNSNF